MKIVPFEESLAEQVCELWNREIGDSYPMSKRVLLQNSLNDQSFFPEGSLVALDMSGKVTGVILSKFVAPDSGHIAVLLIQKIFRNCGIGMRMLSEAEYALREHGARKVSLGGGLGHFFPGVPDIAEPSEGWFDRRGYRLTGTTYDMIGDFRGQPDVLLPKAEGVVFALCDENGKEPLLAFLNRQFPGRWANSAAHYFDLGGTGREFVLAWKDEQVIGFCRINDAKSPTVASNQFWVDTLPAEAAGIGPLGIAAECRGQGLGLAIVKAGMHELQSRGIRMMAIDWVVSLEFYGKLGFEAWKRYRFYSKEF